MRRIHLSDEAPDDSDTLSKHMEIALQARQAGDLQRAESACEAILTLDPNRPDAWHLLGLLRDDGNDARGAIELLRQAIDLDPTNPQYHFSLAAVFQRLGHGQRARQVYRHARQLDPGLSPVLDDMQG